MTGGSRPKRLDNLREWAERLLLQRAQNLEALTGEEVHNLVRELQARQIELESQNEKLRSMTPEEILRLVRELGVQNSELQRVQTELKQSRDRYLSLFHSAPIGYFTLNRNKKILEVNSAGAGLLDTEEHQLINQKFTRFIAPESGDAFASYWRNVFKTGTTQECQLALLRSDGTLLSVCLEGVVIPGPRQKQCLIVIDVSHRRQMEQASQAAQVYQKQVQRLIDSDIIGIQISSADGGIISANDAYLNIVGYTREDMLAGRINWRELTPPEYRWLDDRSVRAVLEAGYCAPYEKEYIRRDGSRMVVMLGSVLWEAGEKPTAVSFVLDISSRKRAETALQRTLGSLENKIVERTVELEALNERLQREVLERRRDEAELRQRETSLRLLLEQIPGVVWALDRELRFTWFLGTPFRKDLKGSDLLGMTIYEYFGTNDPGAVAIKAHLQALSGSPGTYEREQDGMSVYGHIEPLYDAGGEVAGVIGIALDITERKRVENDLRRKETSLRMLLEQMSGIVWTVDKDLRFTWVLGVPLKGQKPADMVGKTLYEHLANEPNLHIIRAHRQALTGTASSYERQQQGRTRSAHVEPLYDAGGNSAGVVGIALDITEHKGVEEELRELSRRLVNAQENERRAIARELHDQVSQSLALLKLLLDRAISTPAGKLNFGFSEAQELAMELITQIRDMSLNLRPKMLDDLGLLPTLIWHFERYTSQARIKVGFRHSGIEKQFPPEISTAAYRVVQEALSNVAHHAHVGEVWVRVWADEKSLSITIKDRGAGFDPACLKTASTGISGMRERIMLLGGRLTLKTAPGAGTSIRVRIPLAGAKGG